MNGYLDMHQHVIYGVDDGPQTLEESMAMLAADRADGITHVVATSHAMPSMERFPTERYIRHLNKLNQISADKGLGVTIYGGCEVFYTEVAARLLIAGELPTLAGSRYALIEFDPTSTFDAIVTALRRLTNNGLIPVIAHCERYEALVKHPRESVALRESFRVRLQVNASTIIGRVPRPVRKFRDLLLDEGVLDYIATDAHNTAARKPNLGEAYRAIEKRYGAERADKLTRTNQNELFA